MSDKKKSCCHHKEAKDKVYLNATRLPGGVGPKVIINVPKEPHADDDLFKYVYLVADIKFRPQTDKILITGCANGITRCYGTDKNCLPLKNVVGSGALITQNAELVESIKNSLGGPVPLSIINAVNSGLIPFAGNATENTLWWNTSCSSTFKVNKGEEYYFVIISAALNTDGSVYEITGNHITIDDSVPLSEWEVKFAL